MPVDFVQSQQLRALPESFVQLAALQELHSSDVVQLTASGSSSLVQLAALLVSACRQLTALPVKFKQLPAVS